MLTLLTLRAREVLSAELIWLILRQARGRALMALGARGTGCRHFVRLHRSRCYQALPRRRVRLATPAHTP
jgi:hypothetical protein